MSISKYRPGVYSQYSISSIYQGEASALGLAVAGSFGTAGTDPIKVTPGTALPECNALMQEAVELVLGAGVGSLWLLPVAENATPQEWTTALEKLADKEIALLVCQSSAQGVLEAVRDFAQGQAESQKELVAFGGCTDPSAAATLAKALNSERMVLVCGAPTLAPGGTGDPFYGAVALAGAVALMEDPSASLTGETLSGLDSVAPLTYPQIDSLLEAGVTPLCPVGERVEVLRAMTTRTVLDGAANRSLTPLNAILIIDYVMKALRESLRGLLKGAKNTPQTLSAVASQITVLLSGLAQRNIITQYQAPRVFCPAESPEVCVAQVAFTAAYLINQIQIQAHIQL